MTEALAARTAYAIGLHRTEVNASFGVSTHKMRSVVACMSLRGIL